MIAQHQHIVRKQVRMDHRLRQVSGPMRIQPGKFVAYPVSQPRLDLVEIGAAACGQSVPARLVQPVGALLRKSLRRLVQFA